MTPEETAEFTKDVIVKAMRLVLNGSEVHGKAAVSAIDMALDNFRPFAGRLDEIPIIIIAADKFRHKGKDGSPAWDRIAYCNFADVADHPWSLQCARAKGDQVERTEAATSDAPNINVNVEERVPVQKESSVNVDTLASKRDLVKRNADTHRGRRQKTTAPSAPRPSCSTCLSRGTSCVANASGACKGCRASKKRCDYAVRKEDCPSSPVMSAKRTRSQSRSRTATFKEPISSPLSRPLAKRQRQQTVATSEECKNIPVTARSEPLKGSETRTALPSASAPNLSSPSRRQRATRVKQAVAASSDPSSEADLTLGRIYSLRGEPLVTGDEVAHLYDQQRALIGRTEKLEKLYDDMITDTDKLREQHDAMITQMEDLTRGMISALRALQKHVGVSLTAGDVCR